MYKIYIDEPRRLPCQDQSIDSTEKRKRNDRKAKARGAYAQTMFNVTGRDSCQPVGSL